MFSSGSVDYLLFQLIKVADNIFISKTEYGVQLYGKVRNTNEDVKCTLLEDIQRVQNKLLRWLNGITLKDRRRTSELLKNLNMWATLK